MKKKIKILLVEDTSAIRLLIKMTLKKREYEILEAENGRVGMNLLCAHDDIDLIILDILMPEVDGHEFLKKMKNIDLPTRPKVIMLTSKGRSEDIKKSLRLGAHDYVIKPIDQQILLNKVDCLLGGENEVEFFEAKTSIEAIVLHPKKNLSVEVIGLSENSISLISPMVIPETSKFVLDSNLLRNLIKVDDYLFLRVMSVINQGGQFLIKASLIGINEQQRKYIRRSTLQGEVYV